MLTDVPPEIAGGFQFGEQAFQLEVFQNNSRMNNFTFVQPVIITIDYTNADIFGLDENFLTLFYSTMMKSNLPG